MVLAVLSLAGVERGARYANAMLASPTREARWIWAPGDWWDRAEAVAFDLACDFDLGQIPEHAVLAVGADEEYVLSLNGRAVGAGRFAAGAPLDAYDVQSMLAPGGNRLFVRLRSARGEGGFLASLFADGRQILASGERCRVFMPAPAGVLEGWQPLGNGIAPVVWGLPPTGRWGASALGPVREPRATQRRLGEAVAGLPRAISIAGSEGASQEMTLFEWPRQVTGLLRLSLARNERGAALLFLDDRVPDPRLHRSERVIVTADGDRDWIDVKPRSFRFALVAGLQGVRAAAVIPTAPDAGGTDTPRGVFGLRSPPIRLAVEDEIRRRLNGFEGLQIAGRGPSEGDVAGEPAVESDRPDE